MVQWLASMQRGVPTGEAADLPTVRADAAGCTDLEMLAVGALAPLRGLMRAEDYASVAATGRLADGTAFGLPIALPIEPEEAEAFARRGTDAIAVVGPDGLAYAVVEHAVVYAIDLLATCRGVFGTESVSHPGVRRMLTGPSLRLGGDVVLLRRPPLPMRERVLDPAEVRAARDARGWRTMVGFQTRNPVHRAHEYIQKVALETVDGLLLHPLVGPTQEEDLSAEVRMRAYDVLLAHYFPPDRVVLAAFPAAMRYAGPREALFHAVVRRNYGCTHFIVGRDHAGVGGFYDPFAAQRYVAEFAPELGVQILAFSPAFYCRRCGSMATERTCPHGPEAHVALSGTEVRRRLKSGEPLPDTFTRPEVATVLSTAGSRPTDTLSAESI